MEKANMNGNKLKRIKFSFDKTKVFTDGEGHMSREETCGGDPKENIHRGR